MKKSLYILLVLVVIFLGACSTEKESSIDETKDNVNDKNENINLEEQNEEDSEVDESDSISDEVEEQNDVITKEPQYKMNEIYSIVPIDDANPKVVLLTIDDAPDKYSLEMAKTLKELDAPAIFFVNGHFIQTPEKQQILKEIFDLGFVIGNHTATHPNLKEISAEEQKEEIISVNDMVEKITGERPKFFRAPFGVNTEVSQQIAADENMLLMNWSFGYDWDKQYMTKEAIADIMVNTPLLANGSNLLMHDRKWTAEGLESIVTGLREKGYEPVDPKLIQTPNIQ